METAGIGSEPGQLLCNFYRPSSIMFRNDAVARMSVIPFSLNHHHPRPLMLTLLTVKSYSHLIEFSGAGFSEFS